MLITDYIKTLNPNIRRGLMRFSIVITIIWIVGVTAYIATGPLADLNSQCYPQNNKGGGYHDYGNVMILPRHSGSAAYAARDLSLIGCVVKKQRIGQKNNLSDGFMYTKAGIKFTKWLSWAALIVLTPILTSVLILLCFGTYLWVSEGFSPD